MLKYDILFIYLTYWPEDAVYIQRNMSSFSFKNVVFFIQVVYIMHVFMARNSVSESCLMGERCVSIVLCLIYIYIYICKYIYIYIYI